MSFFSLRQPSLPSLRFFVVGILCMCAFGLSHCVPLPACFEDRDCAPYRCVAQQCVKAVEPGKEPAESPSEASKNTEPATQDRASEPSRQEDSSHLDGGEFSVDAGVERKPDAPERDAGSSPKEHSPEQPVPETIPETAPEAVPETVPEPKTWRDFSLCAGQWVLPAKDPKNCGRCGLVCAPGERCCGGTCGKGSAEVCNGKDDDCDGVVDEDTTNCVLVYAGLDLAQEGPGLWTPLSGPMGLALDSTGNLYIAERNRFRVRKLSPDGILTTVAGSGTYSVAGLTEGLRVNPALANFQGPAVLRLEPGKKHLYTMQSVHTTVWKVPLPGVNTDLRVSGMLFSPAILDLVFLSPTKSYYSTFTSNSIFSYDWGQGKATLYAGGGGVGTTDGPRLQARIGLGSGLALDSKGFLYIADARAFKVRKIDANEHLVTHAGTGIEGAVNGPRARASFSELYQMVFDSQDNLYVADGGNHQIRMIPPNGQVSTFAGTAAGYLDGPLLQAKFFWPTGLVRDPQGNFFVADTGNLRIRKIDTQGNVTTIAGATQFRDGAVHPVQLNEPMGLAFDSKGNLYVADSENQRVLRLDPQGKQSVFVGSGAQRILRIRTPYAPPGPQTMSVKHVWYPTDVAVDANGNVAVAQQADARVLRISPPGKAFLWGQVSPTAGYDGSWKYATFKGPQALAFAQDGSLLVADTKGHRIRVIDASNENISTLVGSGTQGMFDGDASKAKLDSPQGLLVDHARKRLYIADTGNHRIRVYDFTTKKISPFAGSSKGYKDGVASDARFHAPIGLSWGPQQKEIYVADRNNHCIRKISLKANGDADTVATFLGDGFPGSSGGNPKQTRFNFPTHVRWGPDQKLYISDTGNHLLRVFQP